MRMGRTAFVGARSLKPVLFKTQLSLVCPLFLPLGTVYKSLVRCCCFQALLHRLRKAFVGVQVRPWPPPYSYTILHACFCEHVDQQSSQTPRDGGARRPDLDTFMHGHCAQDPANQAARRRETETCAAHRKWCKCIRFWFSTQTGPQQTRKQTGKQQRLCTNNTTERPTCQHQHCATRRSRTPCHMCSLSS